MGFFNKNEEPPKDVSEALEYIKRLEDKIDGLSKEIMSLEQKSRFSVKKVDIKRFNPFGGQGGDQSFSLVMLDENNDGVVVTSLFTNQGNRVYAKPIKKGSSEYTLSTEEKEILEKLAGQS